MSSPALLFVLFSLSTISFTSSQSPQVCLNCWNNLCAPGVFAGSNIEDTCPCPCINSTQYSLSVDKCSQNEISIEDPSVCCPKADNFVTTQILSQLTPDNVSSYNNSSSSCTPNTIYNQAPANLIIDSYEQITGSDDTDFVFYGTPFNCSGCIDSVTIYHLINEPGVRNMTVQLWSKYKNMTDNSTVLRGRLNHTTGDYNITFDSTNSQADDNGNYYFTKGYPTRDICFSAGEIFGAIVPSAFSNIDILQAKDSSATPQVYDRSTQSCDSLANIFYLSHVHNPVLIAINVTRAINSSSTTVSVVPSTVDTSQYTSLMTPTLSSLPDNTITSSDSTSPMMTPSHSSFSSQDTLVTQPATTTGNTISTSTGSIGSNSVSSSSVIIINTTPDVPTGSPNTNIIIYTSAGVVVVVILSLIVVVLALICLFIRYNRGKGNLSIGQKPMEMTSDSLDFQRHRAVNPHEYVQGSLSNVSTRATPPAADHERLMFNQRSDLVDSMLIHDYDHPDALNFVEFNRSRETLNASRRQSPSAVGSGMVGDTHTYMPMSSSVRTHTPSSVSLGSDRSHYSVPRPVNHHRYQSPSTNQRYDSPRSIAGSSTTSDYDDPSRVLEKTPRPQQRIMRGNVRTQDELPPLPQPTQGEHHYDEPIQPQVIPHTNHYFVLDNQNEATGQAEQRHPLYHELEPPSQQSTIPRTNHYHVLEKGSGYHVPTNVERQSILVQGTFPNIQEENQFFLNQPIYYEPPEETEHIYAQLNQFKCREIPLEKITIEDKLGEGEFGTVFLGAWEIAGGMRKPVAIKRLKVTATEEEKKKFLREGARQMQFYHANVVKLLGVVTVKDPPLLVQELMRQGDLKTYLKSCRPTTTDSQQMRPVPSPQQLLKFCRDIASGMRHLAGKKFVHRDLAARNVLLNDNLICKIADFGMTRALDHVYDLNKVEQIPLRWTAPEAFQGRLYSEQSDVYSYGMVLYEIWSLGRKPFPNHKQNQEIIDFITQKMLMPPPPGCPRNIYSLMVKCWNPFPNGRLSFDTIYNDYFGANSEALLTWDRDDLEECSLKADQIGAPLPEGYRLYIDLQHEYRN